MRHWKNPSQPRGFEAMIPMYRENFRTEESGNRGGTP